MGMRECRTEDHSRSRRDEKQVMGAGVSGEPTTPAPSLAKEGSHLHVPRQPTARCRLPTARCRLPTAYCPLLSPASGIFT
jgi:hypothetical protein